MKKVIIPQKQSNTGSIHDIASQDYDREIKFPKGAQYAVVLASYYGGKGYTTHATEGATIQADKRQSEFSRQIIGVDGWIYEVNINRGWGGSLERYIDQREPYEVLEFEAITEAAAALGSIRSNAKAEAVRENGRKSKGRPKKV